MTNDDIIKTILRQLDANYWLISATNNDPRSKQFYEGAFTMARAFLNVERDEAGKHYIAEGKRYD